ncbi:hypothetical protein EXE30_02145 [Acinetobacter halotolerans]|uniref:Lipoprotein n=1 Tax=Acinetobacter halotolerans TaxID=1752076 RepID=A0A4V2DB71_9GAMM|nr:hypothetical protein [Acinetobacter halotolerans]RZF55629.1 hypothetical protein EXE30_02145 [Acinetobacter halotolerans]
MIAKKKMLIFFLGLLLSACNDNNESLITTDNIKPIIFEQWTKFNFVEREPYLYPIPDDIFGEGSDDGSAIVSSSRTTLTFYDNDLYEKSEFFDMHFNHQIQFKSYVTNNGIFESNTTHQQYGRHLGKLTLIDEDEWVLSPTLVSGTGNFSKTTNYKVLDISGQKVFYTIDPQTAIKFNGIPYFDPIYGVEATRLYKKLSSSTFLSGSKCIQIQTVSQDQDTLDLIHYPKPAPVPYDQVSIQALWERYKAESNRKILFKDTEGYIADYGNSGVAKLNGIYYYLNFYAKGEVFSFEKIVDEVKKEFDYIDDLDLSGSNYSGLYVDLSKQSCHYFNPQATELINNLTGLV